MRNKVLHKERCLLSNNLVINTNCYLEDYMNCNDVSISKSVVKAPPPCWIPPSRGCFLANEDAIMDSSCGVCGFGLIIRDELGYVLVARWKFGLSLLGWKRLS